MARVNPSFLEGMKCREEFDASACMHCGVCTAVCPVGFDLLPRRIGGESRREYPDHLLLSSLWDV